jgi:hypothetical protein
MPQMDTEAIQIECRATMRLYIITINKEIHDDKTVRK